MCRYRIQSINKCVSMWMITISYERAEALSCDADANLCVCLHLYPFHFPHNRESKPFHIFHISAVTQSYRRWIFGLKTNICVRACAVCVRYVEFLFCFWSFFLAMLLWSLPHNLCGRKLLVWCCCCWCCVSMRMCWTCVNLSVHNGGHSFSWWCGCFCLRCIISAWWQIIWQEQQ